MSLFDMMSQPRQQATPSTGLGLLLGEAQKTAGMFGGQVGKTLGIDTRDKREIELDAVKKAIAGAEGETLQERLANAIPAIAEVNPVLGIAFAEQLRGMKGKGQIVQVPTGEFSVDPLTRKKVPIKAPAYVVDGDFVRWVKPSDQENLDPPPSTKTGDTELTVEMGQNIGDALPGAPKVELRNGQTQAVPARTPIRSFPKETGALDPEDQLNIGGA